MMTIRQKLKGIVRATPGTCELLRELYQALEDMNADEWDNCPVQARITADLRALVEKHERAEKETF